MLKVKIEIGQEEAAAVRELALLSPEIAKKRKPIRVLSVIAVVLMGFAAVINFLNHSLGYALLGLILAIIFGWLAFDKGIAFQNFILKKHQNKSDNRLISGFREYHFDDDGVGVSSEIGQSTNKWDAFKYWGIFKNYIYLRRLDNQILLVKISDLSKEDYALLISILEAHLTQTKTA
ncbi:MAG: YcxB family protein [Eubacterium sp.]|nr:YcxB family protein [Eubacterium sp.]